MYCENIKNIVSQAHELQNSIIQHIKTLPGRMNLLDIADISSLENKHSKIIEFFIEPDEEHRHPEYGRMFLDMLREKGLPIKGELESVQREKITHIGRRIDLLIKTDQNEYIIIENKVYAGDLEDQIKDYYDWVKSVSKTNQTYVLYLTLDGRDPSEKSFKGEIRRDLEGKKCYSALSYSEDIIKWLDNMTVKTENENLLQSSIIQYKDTIRGLCNRREGDVLKKNIAAEKLFRSYDNYDRESLLKVLDAVNLFNEGIVFTVVVNFLSELKKTLEENFSNSNNKVYYIIDQEREASFSKWIASAIKHQKNLGVEIALEKNQEDPYGLAIEFGVLERNSISCSFGVIAHGKNEANKNTPYNRPLVRQEGLETKKLDNPYWFEEKEFSSSSWFIEALLGISEWENNMKKTLSKHVAENWFGNTIHTKNNN